MPRTGSTVRTRRRSRNARSNHARPQEHPLHHQRPAALVHPRLPESRGEDPQPGPPGRARHGLPPRLYGEPHLHAHPGELDHRTLSQPAWRLQPRHQADGGRAHGRRLLPGRRVPHGPRGQGPLPAPHVHAGVPFPRGVSGSPRPRLLARLHRPLLRVRAGRTGPEPHGRGPCRPALRPVDDGKGLRRLARLLPAHGQAVRRRRSPRGFAAPAQPARRALGHSRGTPLQRLDRGADERAHEAVRRRRRELLPLGQLLRPPSPVHGARALRPACTIRPP